MYDFEKLFAFYWKVIRTWKSSGRPATAKKPFNVAKN